MRFMWKFCAVMSLAVGFGLMVAAQGECGAEMSCTEVASARITSYGVSAEVIVNYEQPNFSQLVVDSDLLHDRWYMTVEGTINIHDAPNGNVTRTLDNGFNFITALRIQDDWVEINPGEWVNTTHLTDSNYVVSNFTGVFLPEDPLEYPLAWLLVNLYPSDEPGAEPLESNGLMYRYTQVTIFDSVEVDGWNWYQIGKDQWVQQTHVAKHIPIKRPEDVMTDRWVAIDLYEQVLTVYADDKAIFTTLISTGLPRWPTYEGTFNIYYRRTRHNMSWGTPGDDFYYLEEVPWTMFFDEGRALHGAYWHDGLGYRRSHGCVNMSITDAHWLYNWIAEEFEKLNSPDVEEGPNVHVFSSGTYR